MSDEDLVEKCAERIDVASRVGGAAVDVHLFRARVGRCADERVLDGDQRSIGEGSADRFGDAEIDQLRQRRAALPCDQDVGRFQVAVNDPFLMRVLQRAADLDE